MVSSKREGRFTDYIIRGGINPTALKLNSGQPVTVAFIGGSVTAGAGASDASHSSYRAWTCRYLERSFPKTAFRFVNAAIGGTDSVYGAFRIKEHVFKDGPVDLLFVEYAVNDAGNRTESVRAMEGIVRQAKRINPKIGICFLYLANKPGIKQFSANGKGQLNIFHHEEVADYYRIPSVHIAGEIYRMIESGKLEWEQLSGDEVHPNDYGYSLYGRFMEHFLEEALQARASEPANIADLPAPIDPFCYENADLVSPDKAANVSGWRTVNGWTTERTCNWTPPADIFVAESPGAGFRIPFTGTAGGISMLAGMDTGDVQVSVDGGEWRAVQLFDRYCPMFYRPKIVLFADGLSPGEHVLDVRISEERHEDSTGHAIRILKLLVN
ncbi:GDSL-type esterase/lipase family protein [Paenibacillus hodogayensis]|uniref:GDSL-type esterase/lipase family protein n=1 Tax=Paenibacillus hodogayensis TaxID=279208 RepID=A0ABV5VVM2_9BACL